MNTSNLIFQPLQPLQNRYSVRTRSNRRAILSSRTATSNILPTNTYTYDDEYIRCPVCNNEYELYELFTHIFLTHEEFLAVWSSLSFPSLDVDNPNSLNEFFRNLGISNNVLNQETYIDGFDLLSYEQLNALCDEIGYHKVGVKNIDTVAPATIRMKKTNVIDDRCPICLEDMHKALYMRIIKNCGHEYCGECIEKWLQENKSCPICKLEIIEEDNQISSIFESSNGGNDTSLLTPVPTPESSSESLANTT